MTPTTTYVKHSTDGFAIASLVFAIFALLLGPLGSIPAIILGHISRWRIRKYTHLQGEGIALAGLIVAYIITIFSLVIIGLFLTNFYIAASASPPDIQLK